MKQKVISTVVLVTAVAFALAIFVFWNKKVGKLEDQLGRCEKGIAEFVSRIADVETLISRFDSMEVEGISKKKWDLIRVSHADDVRVIWPDGHSTTGVERHIQDLRTFFAFASDIRIYPTSTRFGWDDRTCVETVFAGTFTKPIPIGGRRTIQPTGREVRVRLCTVARWRDGKIEEKSLYWDSQTFLPKNN